MNPNSASIISPTNSMSPFWQLLRAGIWSDSSFVQDFPVLSTEQWKGVLGMAKRSGTIGLMCDAIEMLADDKRPSENMLLNLAMTKVKNMGSHTKHNATIAELFKVFADHNVKAVLLKGQLLAQNYPTPESRGCGDIDVFIGEQQIDRTVGILKDLGYTCEEEINDNEKHVVLYFNGLGVELHRHALYLPLPGKNAKFQKWWNGNVFSAPEAQHIDANGKWNKVGDGQAVYAAEVNLNVFFTFCHVFKHYISEVQFRQFFDLARLLYVEKGRIDRDALLNKLKELGLLLPWQIIGCYMHRYIGLAIDCIPGYDEEAMSKVAKFERRINKRYFNPNYKRGKRPKGLAGKLYSYRGYYANATETVSLFPKFTIANLWDCTVRGISLLFNKDNRPDGDTASHYQQRMQSASTESTNN